jgi:hypothetical protein
MKKWILMTAALTAMSASAGRETINFYEGWRFARFGAMPVGNGDPTSHESFQALERKVFNGLALVVIRSKKSTAGTIQLTASSAGLHEATITVEVK